MEDIERDIQKSLKDPALTKPKKRSTQWTLLFVGDHGKIVRIRKFKLLVFVWLSALLFSTAAAAGFYYLYRDKTEAMVSLKEALNGSREKARILRDEKDLLIARLVVAESKLQSEPSKPEPKKVPKEQKPEPVAGISPIKTPETAQPIQTVEDPPSLADVESDEENESAVAAVDQGPVEESSFEIVDIDDFFAIVEEDSNTLRIKYKIRNVSQSPKMVSGRTFMILKGKEDDQKNWLVFPEVPLLSGRPSRVNSGKSFSITRFKTIRFKAPYLNDDKPFSEATILVYSNSGDLLLKKNFPIKAEGEEATPVD